MGTQLLFLFATVVAIERGATSALFTYARTEASRGMIEYKLPLDIYTVGRVRASLTCTFRACRVLCGAGYCGVRIYCSDILYISMVDRREGGSSYVDDSSGATAVASTIYPLSMHDVHVAMVAWLGAKTLAPLRLASWRPLQLACIHPLAWSDVRGYFNVHRGTDLP
jgi:hypothetical protein